MTEAAEHFCPGCGVSLRGERIPDEQMPEGYRDRAEQASTETGYPYDLYYHREIGVHVRGVYDGTLYWMCPDCGHRWHRFPEGHPRHEAARKYVEGVEQP